MNRAPVLVTGAGGGIGQAVADRLRAAGVPVIGWDLAGSEDEGIVRVDVTDEDSVSAAVERLPHALSAVVSCAGVGSRTAFADAEFAEFRRVIEVNLIGTALVAHAVHSRLTGGAFVAIGSVAASVPLARRSAYCASKAAVVMLAKVLGSEWAGDGIQVLCVSPGFVDIGMATQGAREGGTDLAAVLERTPTRSLVSAPDLVDILELAALGRLSGMTATELVVDGGYVSGTRI